MLTNGDASLPLHLRESPITQPIRPAVNLRSVTLGLTGVLFICGVTPYNDYVLNNTPLIGNFLPIGPLLLFLLVVFGINAPLWRWAPRQALSQHELAVAMGMTLVSCTLPATGLMRFLPPHLVALYVHTGTDAAMRDFVTALALPDWMFPTFASHSIDQRSIDPLVTEYWNRAITDHDTFFEHLRAVPWAAWVRPAITWGALLASIYGAILCTCVIIHRQWVFNERLPFPLATIYLSLIESPKPGKALNSLFSSRVFWIAFATVFVIHGINGLQTYIPQVPEIPLNFDLKELFADPPWTFTDWGFKASQIFFTVFGLTYFIRGDIAFSLWGSFVIVQLVKIMAGASGTEYTQPMQMDEQFGALPVFGFSILWIGRKHWSIVFRQMLRGARSDEPRGIYLPYSLAGWGLVGSIAAVIVWLWIAGASLAGAIIIVSMMMLLFITIARVVAETGLIFTQIRVPLHFPFAYALSQVPQSLVTRFTNRAYFLACSFNSIFTYDMRETLSVYATHALRLADVPGSEKSPQPGGWKYFVALSSALLIGYLVAGASTLYFEYQYSTTQDVEHLSPLNPGGVDHAVRELTLNYAMNFDPPGTGPVASHNRPLHFGIGAIITGILAIMRGRFAAWPLHPVGFLMSNSLAMRYIWFSIFTGWVAKTLIIRLGGAKLYSAANPLFIGLIVGETASTFAWLVVSLVLHSLGMEYHTIRLMPR